MPIPSEAEAEIARAVLQGKKEGRPGTGAPEPKMLNRLGDLVFSAAVLHDYWMSRLVQAIEQQSGNQQQ